MKVTDKANNLRELETIGAPVPSFLLMSDLSCTLSDVPHVINENFHGDISIRSSPQQSLPGILKTELNVRADKDSITKAFQSVYDSSYSKIAKLAYKRYGLGEPIIPQIIFQDMVSGIGENSGSGIWYTSDPKHSGEPIYVYKKNCNGDAVSGKSATDLLPDRYVEILTNWGIAIERHFKHPQDIEFTIDNGILWFLQTRNVVFEKIISYPEIEGTLIDSGTAIVSGVGSGIFSESALDTEYILLADHFEIQLEQLNRNCKGIIVKEGNGLCHAAILARKDGIPCIKLDNPEVFIGELLTVDGRDGNLYKL